MIKEIDIIKKLNGLQAIDASQDPIDRAAEELAISDTILRYAKKRREEALMSVTALIEDKIAAAREQAVKLQMKSVQSVYGQNMAVSISCNAPAMRVNVDKLMASLAKQGVSEEIRTKAQREAAVQSAPATTIAAMKKE